MIEVRSKPPAYEHILYEHDNSIIPTSMHVVAEFHRVFYKLTGTCGLSYSVVNKGSGKYYVSVSWYNMSES